MPSSIHMGPAGGLDGEMVDSPSLPCSSHGRLEIQSSPQSTSSKKRKRPVLSASEPLSSHDEVVNSEDQDGPNVRKPREKLTPQVMTKIRLPGFIYPRSMYKNYDALDAMDTKAEKDVLRHALAGLGSRGQSQSSGHANDFISLNLEDFCIYRPHMTRKVHNRELIEEKPTANELVSLHEVNGRSNNSWFFDGFICYGQSRHYVQRVPCTILSIGGFEDTDLHTVGSAIWCQTKAGRELDVWYCLRNASKQYDRFHKPFLWLADLAKHLVDYLHTHEEVQLSSFRQHFHKWLQQTHGADQVFQTWLRTYNDTDFRRIVAAHALFLRNQAGLVRDAYTLHPLWDEVDPKFMQALPSQTQEIKSYGPTAETDHAFRSKTVVTPFVYDCFKHLPWAKFLDVQHISAKLRQKRSRAETRPNVTFKPFAATAQKTTSDTSLDFDGQQDVQIGEVIAVKSDSRTSWKSNDTFWYGYVQATMEQKRGTKLSLIWLYDSSHTPCQGMKYPFANELFLGDHCNCDDTPIYAHEVVSKPRVAFFGDSATPNADFFVRQKYIGAESAWVTLALSDFKCTCSNSKKVETFQAGTTHLVTSRSSDILEPIELIEYSPDLSQVRVRRLQRRTAYGDHNADHNELVYTSRIEELPASYISRSCHVRFYSEEEKEHGAIPVPYCRNGVADFFYITSQELPAGADLVPLIEPWPKSLMQGFNPTSPPSLPALRGLDIFCGGGSLGRGLEDGGAVKMEWAVDYFKQAIHTYSANSHNVDEIKLFYGSVNDYLSQAMKGNNRRLIAQSKEVQFIAAGSPCQGFSQANQRKTTDQSLINISMVASVVSFVDFYKPKYAILENVLGMAKCGTRSKEQNVYAQVLCALVAMGYQVRSYILDAWNFGSPQGRTRVFFTITAPGLMPLPDPPQSHSHPSTIENRALGRTANGLPLGERYWGPTPFKYITIREATKDLPLKEDGKVDCIPFPDHRVTRNVSSVNQARIAQIPKYPQGMSFIEAANKGWMPKTQMDAWRWDHNFRSNHMSRAWKRVFPDGLLPTVTTACCPEDSISGQWLHWDADRPMTIMEARRAQGFPDYEVILGTPLLQWKIIGNSVARPVALALGVALRTAWLANEKLEAKASAKQFAQGLEIARKTAILPATKGKSLVPKSHLVSDDVAVSSTSNAQNDIAFRAAIRNRTLLTKTYSQPLHSPSNMEDPIVLSSDSEYSDSGSMAVFTSSPSKNSTRETTNSDIVVTKENNIIRIEVQKTGTHARETGHPRTD